MQTCEYKYGIAACALSRLVRLCCVVLYSQSKFTPTCISCAVSAIEMAGLLQAKMSTSQNVWERTQNFEWKWFLPESERRTWNNDAIKMMMWEQCSNAQVTGVTQTQLWRNLQRDDFNPYNHKLLQHIFLGDHANRVWFYEWLQPLLRILLDILFTDET
jgi:hypothetical protein